MTLALVVLAGGASARLGEPKALVDLAGASPLVRLLTAGLAAEPEAVLVVLGRDLAAGSAAVAALLQYGAYPGPTPRVVENAAWQAGRLGSVAAAARALPGVDMLVAPVDVPLVTGGTFRTLGQAWRAAGAPDEGWLAPCHRGRHGHPVVLGRTLAARAAGTAPDVPLRTLRAGARPLFEAETADEGVLDDLDTPEDLAALRRRLVDRAS